MNAWLPLTLKEVNPDLSWCHEFGIGKGSPAIPQIYDAGYWKKYLHYDHTKLGCRLTDSRLAFVRRYFAGASLLDVGIGGGLFVKTARCLGYDINPFAREWLLQEVSWSNPYNSASDAMTFWDSMEHIDQPGTVLKNCREWAFISMPIYRDVGHCLISKHFRPGEHVWYFTREGLTTFMLWQGFRLEGVANFEQRLGREDILTFAFKRSQQWTPS